MADWNYQVQPSGGYSYGQQVCDTLVEYDTRIYSSWIDVPTKKVYDYWMDASWFEDRSSHYGSPRQWYNTYWLLKILDPRWYGYTDESRTLTGQILTTGLNYLSTPYARAVQVHLELEPERTLREYNPITGFGTWGYATFGDMIFGTRSTGVGPVNWINFPDQVITAPGPLYYVDTGINIYLQPGVIGYADVHFAAFPGKMDTEEGFLPSNTGYPYETTNI